jgi:NAD(P)-dependent dehydrogenase (short-subunit alcohol dehydrogenase family)
LWSLDVRYKNSDLLSHHSYLVPHISIKMVILITGASSGIGRTTAEYFAQKGHIVYGTFRKMTSETLSFKPILMDVTDEISVNDAISRIITNENRLDVVINNAGLGMIGALEDSPEDMAHRLFDTNVWGLLRVCRLALPQMRKQQKGLIINISSIAGTMGLPFRGLYSASKAAVEVLTETLSIETKGFGICVCSVLPGDVRTNINQNRMVADSSHSPYKNVVDAMNKKVNAEVGNAAEPMYITQTIEKIIHSSSPKLHYVAGPPLQKLSIWLKRLLPDKVYENILMSHYGLK